MTMTAAPETLDGSVFISPWDTFSGLAHAQICLPHRALRLSAVSIPSFSLSPPLSTLFPFPPLLTCSNISERTDVALLAFGCPNLAGLVDVSPTPCSKDKPETGKSNGAQRSGHPIRMTGALSPSVRRGVDHPVKMWQRKVGSLSRERISPIMQASRWAAYERAGPGKPQFMRSGPTANAALTSPVQAPGGGARQRAKNARPRRVGPGAWDLPWGRCLFRPRSARRYDVLTLQY
ncbi:hypothetical protein K431DRAFT_289815 [Polychaeton citri CBS 116435]|uniref:Uncharacterized protein n=1 Tax=Polychaeton citri CBS 116435 TaxID=1314669 RepID=A0A9P4UKI4_9PEZI|nr:hypothetical protein K431DRAFT_289815 [Polychaeton citri CBS 116435]